MSKGQIKNTFLFPNIDEILLLVIRVKMISIITIYCKQLQQKSVDAVSYLTNGVAAKTEYEYLRRT
jgi:hypothetical protein